MSIQIPISIACALCEHRQKERKKDLKVWTKWDTDGLDSR